MDLYLVSLCCTFSLFECFLRSSDFIPSISAVFPGLMKWFVHKPWGLEQNNWLHTQVCWPLPSCSVIAYCTIWDFSHSLGFCPVDYWPGQSANRRRSHKGWCPFPMLFQPCSAQHISLRSGERYWNLDFNFQIWLFTDIEIWIFFFIILDNYVSQKI